MHEETHQLAKKAFRDAANAGDVNMMANIHHYVLLIVETSPADVDATPEHRRAWQQLNEFLYVNGYR